MARRTGFVGLITSIARDQARAQREAETRARRLQREQERAARTAQRSQALAQKDAQRRHLEECADRVNNLNADLEQRLKDLADILEKTFTVNDAISFESLKPKERFTRQLTIPDELKKPVPALLSEVEYIDSRVGKPNAVLMLLPFMRQDYEENVQEARKAYPEYLTQYQAAAQKREERIQAVRDEYEREKQRFAAGQQERIKDVEAFATAYRQGDAEAVTAYCVMVLERSAYPDDFPQEFRVAYVTDSREVVVEYELPGVDVVPVVGEYRYVKTRDAFEEKPRKPVEIREIYQDVVASVCLRTVHEIFEADQGGHVDVVTFNGFVQAVDKATGRDIRPCLISVRVTKDAFLKLDLRRVDKPICLRNLGAQVSSHPTELLAVRPVVDFNMVDRRFVEESDVISDLESRPNLMELSPFEFENLVGNLFARLGLETRQTQASRDGGVDVVAYDLRPVLGGKVIIQAKRYRNTVGVSAVRDLYGTMMNEGANKGILVTTSGYGADAYEFARDKPIELLTGANLLYLLEQAGVQARIVFPEEVAG